MQMAVKVWLTGFKPFGEHDSNISEEIALLLDGFSGQIKLGETTNPLAAEFRDSEVDIQSTILEVDESGSQATSERLKAINDESPQAIIHLGFAENRKTVSLEATAFNELNFKIQDNSGRLVTSSRINESGHAIQHTSAPMNLLTTEFDQNPLVTKSEDPGRFICNETYFHTLSAIGELDLRDHLGRTIPALFVHLPKPDIISMKEQIEIVKQIIGITVQRPEMQVVGGMLRDENMKLLCARRAAKEYMGGYWEFPGGKVEAGESHGEALAREYFEEFSWQVKPIRICEEYSHAWPEMVVHLTFFLCEGVGELGEPVMTSHDEYRWLSEDDLLSVNWLPPDVEFVKRIQERGVKSL